MLLALAAPALASPSNERFDLELQGADLHAAIRLVAERGDVDVVIPDTVYGTVSIRLDDVTWDGALAAILYVEGLTAVPVGDTLRVAHAR